MAYKAYKERYGELPTQVKKYFKELYPNQKFDFTKYKFGLPKDHSLSPNLRSIARYYEQNPEYVPYKLATKDAAKIRKFYKSASKKGPVTMSELKEVAPTRSKRYIMKAIGKDYTKNIKPTPKQDKFKATVIDTIDDVYNNKKPLIEASPTKLFEKVYKRNFNINKDNVGVIKKIINSDAKTLKQFNKLIPKVTNVAGRVAAGNKIFETVKFKDFDKAYAKAIKSRGFNRAGTVEEFILRDLKRHIDQGGTKFSFAKGNSLEKGWKGLKIKDLTEGDIIDFAAIKKDDPRFKEYKKVFNDIKKLKLTPYTNPVTKEKITLLKGLQEATGIEAPLHIQHGKGVATEPLKNLSIATHKANIGAKIVSSVEDVETLGVRSTIPGGKRVYGPVLSFEDEVNRLTKWADRKILQTEASGFVKPTTPTETLNEVKIAEKINAGNPQIKKLVEKRVNCAEGCLVKVAQEEPGKITRALNSIKNFFVPKPEVPSIKYDDTLGAFVNPATDDVVSQAGLKAWAADNPMPVKAGTAKPGMLRKTGRALAHLGLPLPTAAMDSYFIGKQIQEGRDPAEIAKDPFNWLGLATMEPLTKAAGVADKSGKLASVMRLGMSPGMIRGATRFLGLPGLIISGGLTAYDQYKKYQDKEGFVYDLFNKEEIDNTPV